MSNKYDADRLPPQESHYYVLAATRPPGYFDELIALLPPSTHRVLDAGSGPGVMTLLFASRASSRSTKAVDRLYAGNVVVLGQLAHLRLQPLVRSSSSVAGKMGSPRK